MTDDDTKDALICKNGIEKTIRAVYAQKKVTLLSIEVAHTNFLLCLVNCFFLKYIIVLQGEHPNGDVNGELYEAMRKELRHAVEEIKTELEQVCDLFVSFIIL